MKPAAYFQGVKACEKYLAERAEPGSPIVKGEERNPYSDASDEWWNFQDGWYDRLNLDLAEDDLDPKVPVEHFEEWFQEES